MLHTVPKIATFGTLQAARRQVLTQCPPQLLRLDGEALSEAERKLVTLARSRPSSAWHTSSAQSHSARSGTGSGRKGRRGGSSRSNVNSRVVQTSGGFPGVVARGGNGGRVHGGAIDRDRGDPAAWAPTAELVDGTRLVITGDALHALSVCCCRGRSAMF